MTSDPRGDAEEVAFLEEQLARIGAGGDDAAGVLARLAEAVFPGRVGLGDPARILWPEPNRSRPHPYASLPRAGQASRRDDLEIQIRHSEARFRSLVEQLPAVVFYAALGEEENEVYVSPQIESLLGFTQQEWLTNPFLWYSQLHPDDHQEVISAFTSGVQTGGPFRAQVRFLSRDGAEVWILGEARLIRDEMGRPEYFQGVAFDITMTKRAGETMAEAERAKVEVAQMRAEALEAHNLALLQLNRDLRAAKEAAEAAAQARTTFLATMSHELRTPLNSVIVLANLLADDELTSAQQDMIRRMQLASSHLLELINDVLEFSRLRAGNVELDLRTFDLVNWVDDTLDIVAHRADEKGLELRVAIAEGVPRRLIADEGRLRQVLLNLLANSLKFTAQGFVEVRIDAAPLTGGRWEYECEVRDSGIGIRPEGAAMLFDEFRQADSGIAREFGGTGLGLAICRRLCELMGGRIWVQEAGGREDGPPLGHGPGATIVFTWVAVADKSALTGDAEVGSRPDAPRGSPSAATTGAAAATTGTAGGTSSGAPVGTGPSSESRAGPPPAPAPARGQALPPASHDLRILIAEDNLMNQHVALLLLSAMGYRADVVATGDDAIASVLAAPYDVVLMDVAMPGTDGLAATRAIRQLGSQITQPYIVALTAHAFPGDAESCFEAGMDDYVAKPINRAQLARALAAGAGRAARGPAGLGLAISDQTPPRAPSGADQMAPGAPASTTPGMPGALARPSDPGGSGDDDGDFDPSLPREILTQFGPEPFRQLVAIFRSEAIRSTEEASAAVTAGHPDDAQTAAHRLKSSAANLGARGLFVTCSQLESLARSRSLVGAEALTATMAEQVAGALRRLDAMASGAAAG